jgi:hypothetical protein
MTQPLPRDNYTRLCVMCHAKGRQRPATAITNYRGFAVCDEHSEHTNTEIHMTLTAKKLL